MLMRLFILIFTLVFTLYSAFGQGDAGVIITTESITEPIIQTLPRPRPIRPDDGLSLDKGTIADQFKFVVTRSNSFKDKKIIKKQWINSLKNHVLDSLSTFRKALANEKQLVVIQKDEINALQAKLTVANEQIENLNKEKSSVSFFGAQMNKGAYKGLVWTIIAGLLGGLAFFLYRFKQSNSVTVETRKTVEELRTEFDAYKKRALEREQKVRRELQNVLNKRGEQ